MEHSRRDERSISCKIAAPYASSPRRTAAAMRRYSNSPSIVCLHCDINSAASQTFDLEALYEVDLVVSRVPAPDLIYDYPACSAHRCAGSSWTNTVPAGQASSRDQLEASTQFFSDGCQWKADSVIGLSGQGCSAGFLGYMVRRLQDRDFLVHGVRQKI